MAKLIVPGRKANESKGQEYLGLTEVSKNLAFLHRTLIARWHSKLLNLIPIERELVVVDEQ